MWGGVQNEEVRSRNFLGCVSKTKRCGIGRGCPERRGLCSRLAPSRRGAARPPLGHRRSSAAVTATAASTSASTVAVEVASATSASTTLANCRRRPGLDPHPAAEEPRPALPGPCSLWPRPCAFPAALLPTSCVCGDAAAICCACSPACRVTHRWHYGFLTSPLLLHGRLWL